MSQHIEDTRRQLGELAAMAAQTDAMERKILECAQEQLGKIEGDLDRARVAAMTGDDSAKSQYTDMVAERGRLQQVIAQARQLLAL